MLVEEVHVSSAMLGLTAMLPLLQALALDPVSPLQPLRRPLPADAECEFDIIKGQQMTRSTHPTMASLTRTSGVRLTDQLVQAGR